MAVKYTRHPLSDALDTALEQITRVKERELSEANQLNSMLYSEARDQSRHLKRNLDKKEEEFNQVMGSLDSLDDLYTTDTNKQDILSSLYKSPVKNLTEARVKQEGIITELERRNQVLSQGLVDLRRAAAFREFGSGGPALMSLTGKGDPDFQGVELYEEQDIGLQAYLKYSKDSGFKIRKDELVKQYFEQVTPLTNMPTLNALNTKIISEDINRHRQAALAEGRDIDLDRKHKKAISGFWTTKQRHAWRSNASALEFNIEDDQIVGDYLEVVDTFLTNKLEKEVPIPSHEVTIDYLYGGHDYNRKTYGLFYDRAVASTSDGADNWKVINDMYESRHGKTVYKDNNDYIVHLETKINDVKESVGAKLAYLAGYDWNALPDRMTLISLVENYMLSWDEAEYKTDNIGGISDGDFTKLLGDINRINQRMKELTANYKSKKIDQNTFSIEKARILQYAQDLYGFDFSNIDMTDEVIENLAKIKTEIDFSPFYANPDMEPKTRAPGNNIESSNNFNETYR